MTLSDISIKKPVFAWMLMAGLLVFGAISYLMMGISQLPDVDFPVVTVTVTWAGASPDVMESAVADIIEDAVMSVDGIQLVQSTSQQGQTQITIQFNLEQDINVALQQVQTKISQAQKNLPQTIDPPIITKTNPERPADPLDGGLQRRTASLRDLALFVRDHLKDTLTTINGVGDVSLGGYVDPQMRIWLTHDEMGKREITFEDIIDAINNEHQLAPTGYQDNGRRPRPTFACTPSSQTPQECDDLIIPARAGPPDLRQDPHRRRRQLRGGHRRSAAHLALQRHLSPRSAWASSSSTAPTPWRSATRSRRSSRQLSDILPKGMKMGIVTDTTSFIKRFRSTSCSSRCCMAVLLTSVVCYLFLGTFSSAFNVILAIPVSLIGSFIVLHCLGFTINTFTLMGLSLSIGIVVDDAIMVLENITRHNELGQDRACTRRSSARARSPAPRSPPRSRSWRSSCRSSSCRGSSASSSTSSASRMSVAVMISLLEALTLAPMRCSQFLSVGGGNFVTQAVSRWMDWLAERLSAGARALPELALDRDRSVALVVFGLSLMTVGFPAQGVHAAARSEPLPRHALHEDGLLARSSPTAFSRRRRSSTRPGPEIDSYYVAVGGFGGGLVNQGISFVTMKDPDRSPGRARRSPSARRRSRSSCSSCAASSAKIPGVERVAILDLSLTGFSAQRGYPIEFVLQGPDWEKLADLSIEMRKRMMDSGLMADVDTDYNPNMPETEIYPGPRKAAARGVPVTTIANAISAMVGGLKLLPNKYTDADGPPRRHPGQARRRREPGPGRHQQDLGAQRLRRDRAAERAWSSIKPDSTLLTITRYNRERGISDLRQLRGGQVAVGRDGLHQEDRQGDPAGGLPRHALGQLAGVQRLVQEPDRRA